MDPARYRRIKELFLDACDLSGAEREAFLAHECGADGELRAEVEALLRNDETGSGAASPDALDQAVERTTRGSSAPSSAPRRIGRYRVVGIAGVGGMGTVYEATQESPSRRVAVKVIQSAAARPELLTRFRREAEILGRLQHPGIAQIFEAGEFEEDGVTRPFFAMEYVDGPNVLEYAEGHELALDARVDLFVKICETVHHAHAQGIVHRDLKPDNVLVVEETGTPTSSTATFGGQPKVLDFGVARIVDTDARMTMATGEGQLLGSLPYMSPEQTGSSAHEVGPRSDVYALGVMLYELMTGRLPYDLRGRLLADAVRMIRDEEPTRLGSLDPTLRGDLEVIALKCLEKDPDRRYASAIELAEDLRRHRQNLPIQARPPSTLYQLAKFARRHRALVGGVTGTMLALVAGLVVSILFAVRATDNEARALREADRANLAASAALVDDDPLAARRVLDTVPEARRGWEWRYLDARLRPQLFEFGEVVDGTPLVSVAGGEELLAARDARRMCLWDVATGEELASWSAPEDVACWGVAEDGARIAAGLADGRVLVADARRGLEAVWETWIELDAPAGTLSFTPDGRRIAVGRETSLHLGEPENGFVETELRNAQRPPLVAFSSDGARIGVLELAAYANRVQVRDATTLALIAERYDPENLYAVDFMTDGTGVVVGTHERNVRVCDPETAERVAVFSGHTRPVTGVAWPDGQVLSCSRGDGTLRVWNDAGDCTSVLPCPDVRRAVFLSATRIVASDGERLLVYNLDDERRRVLRGHESYVYEIAFSADGTRVASHAPLAPRELRVWEAYTGRLLMRQPTNARSIALAFDGRGNLRQGWGNYARIQPWFMPGQAERAFGPAFHHEWSTRSKELFTKQGGTPEGELLGAPHVFRNEYGVRDGAQERTVRMFADGRELPLDRRPPRKQPPTSSGPHPRLIVGNSGLDFASFHGWIAELLIFDGRLSDEDAGAVERYLASRLTLPAEHSDAVLPSVGAPLLVQLRADEASVRTKLIGTSDKAQETVVSWTAMAPAGRELRVVGIPDTLRYRPADEDTPARVQFANEDNGTWLEAALPEAAEREEVTVVWLGSFTDNWRTGSSTAYALGTLPLTGEESYAIDTRRRRIGATLSLDAEHKTIAIGSTRYGHTVRLRDATTGDILHEYVDDSPRSYLGVALRADGRRLAIGGTKGTLEVWDTRTHERLGAIDAHVGQVYGVAWSPDGTRIATGANDNAVRIWDAETLELRIELRGHAQYVKALAFSPDGTMLGSASGDGTVRLWDTVPAIERYQSVLAQRRLQADVEPRVRAWLEQLDGPAAVGDAIREAYTDDESRMQAAFTVLALAQS